MTLSQVTQVWFKKIWTVRFVELFVSVDWKLDVMLVFALNHFFLHKNTQTGGTVELAPVVEIYKSFLTNSSDLWALAYPAALRRSRFWFRRRGAAVSAECRSPVWNNLRVDSSRSDAALRRSRMWFHCHSWRKKSGTATSVRSVRLFLWVLLSRFVWIWNYLSWICRRVVERYFRRHLPQA